MNEQQHDTNPRPPDVDHLPRGGWHWLLFSIGALVCIEGTARARSPSCEAAAQRFELKNGLELVLVQDSSLPLVALVSSVHAGSKDDPPGYAGVAHFVEHLTFRGAGPFASAFDLYEEIGATELNATTSPDSTDYFALIPTSSEGSGSKRGAWASVWIPSGPKPSQKSGAWSCESTNGASVTRRSSSS